MKIAYIAPRYLPWVGGVETHIEQLATRVAAHGHTVEVLTQDTNPQADAIEQMGEVTVRRFGVPLPSDNFAYSPGLWTYLYHHGTAYDLVHAHGYHRLPALGAALTKRRPLVFTPHYHGTGHSRLRTLLHKPYRRAGALLFGRSDGVICVSEAEASLVRAHFPHVVSRITVVPNGVDMSALRQARPYQLDRTIMLSAGRLETYKQVDLAIGALRYLDDAFALRVTGDGAARPELEALSARLELGERVDFLGRIPVADLYRWFRTAAVYVNMSSNEAMPVTIVEMLAAGAGVVASNIPAHREIAQGIGADAMELVPLDATPEMVAQAVRAMAARHKQGVLSAPSVASWDDVVARTLDVYQGVCKAA